MTVFLTIIIFLAILIFMILTHELGHYYAAKLVNVKVNQFSIGFGPEIRGWDRGETRYSLKWILAGGSVRICGMDPEEEVSEEDFPRSYYGVSHWRRAVIIIAGSFVHFLIAILLFFLVFWPIGYPMMTGRIGKVQKTVEIRKGEEVPGPGYSIGLKKGDLITSVDGVKVDEWSELSEELSSHPNETVELVYKRGGEKRNAEVKLLKTSDNRGYLGIEVDTKDTFRETLPPHKAAWEALKTTGKVTGLIFEAFGKLFTPSQFKVMIGLEKRTQENPVGIVGAARLGQQAASVDISYLILLVAQLFLVLAIFNLFPLPPLDGGYLLVIVIEILFHKEIDLKKIQPVAVVVLVVLVVIALRLLFLDIFVPMQNPFAP